MCALIRAQFSELDFLDGEFFRKLGLVVPDLFYHRLRASHGELDSLKGRLRP